jgi:hypothetical protein
MHTDIEYQVFIKLTPFDLSNDLHLTVEILPEGTEELFHNVQPIPSEVPSALMAANAILNFIKSGMSECNSGVEASVTKLITN